MSEPEQKRPEPPPATKLPSKARWLLPLAALAVMLGVGLFLHDKLRKEIWSYFTDDQGTRVEVQDGKERYVLWQDPRQNLFREEGSPEEPDPVNQASGRLEAAFSPDGTTMILVRSDPGALQADLYQSTWKGRIWTRPTRVASLNSESRTRPALTGGAGTRAGATQMQGAAWSPRPSRFSASRSTTAFCPCMDSGAPATCPPPRRRGNSLRSNGNQTGVPVVARA